MGARHRERELGRVTGEILQGSTVQLVSRVSGTEVCDDVTGNFGGNNPFKLVSTNVSGGLYTDLTPQFWTFNKVPLPLELGSQLAAPALGSYTNRILSQSGPLTPKVYLPVALFELKDLPKMLKHAGDLLHKIRNVPIGLNPAKEAASSTLAYQFGWGPLVQDIGKMLNLAKMIDNRQKIFREAHSTKGVRRRITLDKQHRYTSANIGLWSSYLHDLSMFATNNQTVDTWATINWVTRNPDLYAKRPDFQDAFNASLGLSKGYIPISVWKAMPWSWAIDWFAGVSDLLQASHNMVYYKPSTICIMRRSVTDLTYHGKRNAFHVYTDGKAIKTWKERVIVDNPNPLLTMRLPFIDNFKLSILGSMTILGLTRR